MTPSRGSEQISNFDSFQAIKSENTTVINCIFSDP